MFMGKPSAIPRRRVGPLPQQVPSVITTDQIKSLTGSTSLNGKGRKKNEKAVPVSTLMSAQGDMCEHQEGHMISMEDLIAMTVECTKKGTGPRMRPEKRERSLWD